MLAKINSAIPGGDLRQLLDNLAADQVDVISEICVRISAAVAERFTGSIEFRLNSHQGTVCDMHVNRGEVIRIAGKRGVRSA